jgi:hypothetical protein
LCECFGERFDETVELGQQKRDQRQPEAVMFAEIHQATIDVLKDGFEIVGQGFTRGRGFGHGWR